MKGCFTINSFREEYILFLITKEEAMYIFTNICRTQFAWTIGIILRPDEVLVGTNVVEDFIKMCHRLGINFLNKNGKIVNQYNEDIYYSSNHSYIRYLRSKIFNELRNKI